MRGCFITTLLLFLLPMAVWATPPGMVSVPGGTFRVLYPNTPAAAQVRVQPFLMDIYPVTNGQMLAFVKAHPQWQRGKVPEVMAEPGYLNHWSTPIQLGSSATPGQPVTRVSWFAARAYCQARGARLPTENEWEFAAAASETSTDARQDPVWQQHILEWYSRPGSAPLPVVGQRPPNVYGIYDLHGLVWEWIEDFGANLVTGDSREGSGADRSRFCGGSAVTAGDKGDYVAFMRYAFRGSLNASWTTSNLGFRCASN